MGEKRTRRYVGAIASESDFGRCDADALTPRLPRPTAESLFDERVEFVLASELAEPVEERCDPRINGWIVLCELTETRGRSDIQACV